LDRDETYEIILDIYNFAER
jgi:hypothetical protein